MRLERLEQLRVVEERLDLGPDREVVEPDRSIMRLWNQSLPSGLVLLGAATQRSHPADSSARAHLEEVDRGQELRLPVPSNTGVYRLRVDRPCDSRRVSGHSRVPVASSCHSPTRGFFDGDWGDPSRFGADIDY